MYLYILFLQLKLWGFYIKNKLLCANNCDNTAYYTKSDPKNVKKCIIDSIDSINSI